MGGETSVNRTVTTRSDVEASVAENTAGLSDLSLQQIILRTPSDRYVDRLVKYLPTESIVTYLAMQNLVSGNGPDSELISRWIVFLIAVVATPIYLRFVAGVWKLQQLAISTLGFAVVAFAVGAPFSSLSWYSSGAAGVALLMYSFLIPLVEPTS